MGSVQLRLRPELGRRDPGEACRGPLGVSAARGGGSSCKSAPWRLHLGGRGLSRRGWLSMASSGAGRCGRRGGRPQARRSGGRVLSALFFFPRGGSAQVASALCRVLPTIGWEVTLAAGSLGSAGERGHAPSFFSGVDAVSVDHSPARRLADPTAAIVPFQPSYEERPGAPDRVFGAVEDGACSLRRPLIYQQHRDFRDQRRRRRAASFHEKCGGGRVPKLASEIARRPSPSPGSLSRSHLEGAHDLRAAALDLRR